MKIGKRSQINHVTVEGCNCGDRLWLAESVVSAWMEIDALDKVTLGRGESGYVLLSHGFDQECVQWSVAK